MDSARKFIKRWYTRYLVATELYMVEPWEMVVIHALLVLVFVLFWYFNKAVLLNGVSQAQAKDPAQLLQDL